MTWMDTSPRRADSAQLERTTEKQRRLAREAELLAEARAEIAAGLFVDSAEVDAWVDSLGTDHAGPVPYPSR